jgi:hypothetical protein
MSYPTGKCPHCDKEITPATIFQKNILRRNILLCPLCNQKILVCRAPGCHNYVKSGTIWDDEICPKCTQIAVIGTLAACTCIGSVFSRLSGDSKLPPHRR